MYSDCCSQCLRRVEHTMRNRTHTQRWWRFAAHLLAAILFIAPATATPDVFAAPSGQLLATPSSTAAAANPQAPQAANSTTETLTLGELLSASAAHSPHLRKTALHTQQETLVRQQANTNYWPKLALNGQATLQSDVTQVSVPVPGITITPPARDQYKLTLDVQQSLWDGGVTSQQKRIATLRAQADRYRAQADHQAVRERVVQLYFAALAQQDQRALAIAVERSLTATEATVTQLQRNGVAAKRDLLLVQARRVEASQAVAEANGQLAAISATLTVLTGRPLSQNHHFAVYADCPVTPPPPSAASTAAPVAFARPELHAVRAQEHVVNAQARLEQVVDRPRVSLFATGGYGRPGLNMLNSDFDAFWLGGVQLNVPLSYFYTRSHQRSNALAALQRQLLQEQRAAIEQQFTAQEQTLRGDIARLQTQLSLDEEIATLRKAVREQTAAQLLLGTASINDLLSDMTAEETATSKAALRRTAASLACAQLALLRGTL